jgi:hypothetical protein
MVDYSKLDLYTLKFIYDEYKNKERIKRTELKTITAEIELIEAFIDHASKLIYRAEQHQIIEKEKTN